MRKLAFSVENWLSTKQRDKPKVNKKKKQFFCLEGQKNGALIKRCNNIFFFQSGFKGDYEPVTKNGIWKIGNVPSLLCLPLNYTNERNCAIAKGDLGTQNP